MVTPAIERELTSFRRPLSPALKLAVTLRHVATGENIRSLAYAFRCGVSSISKIVPEMCQAIAQAYKEQVFNLRVAPEAWTAVAGQFEHANHNVIPGAWRDQVDWLDVDQPHASHYSATADAKHQRELLKTQYRMRSHDRKGWPGCMVESMKEEIWWWWCCWLRDHPPPPSSLPPPPPPTHTHTHTPHFHLHIHTISDYLNSQLKRMKLS